jgi:hypothetical protein
VPGVSAGGVRGARSFAAIGQWAADAGPEVLAGKPPRTPWAVRMELRSRVGFGKMPCPPGTALIV